MKANRRKGLGLVLGVLLGLLLFSSFLSLFPSSVRADENFIDKDGDFIDDDLEQWLLDRYAPYIKLSKKEKVKPISVSHFLEQVDLWIDFWPWDERVEKDPTGKGFYKENDGRGYKEDDIWGNEYYSNEDSDFYLDYPDSKYVSYLFGLGSLDVKNYDNEEIYGHLYEGINNTFICQYWINYQLSIQSNTVIGHEGDWEGLQVYIDKDTGEIKNVLFHIHHFTTSKDKNGIDLYNSEGKKDKNGTHVGAYIAAGSHATYPKPKDFYRRYEGHFCLDYVDGKGDSYLPSVVNVGERGNPMSEDVGWLKFAGRWGEPTSFPLWRWTSGDYGIQKQSCWLKDGLGGVARANLDEVETTEGTTIKLEWLDKWGFEREVRTNEDIDILKGGCTLKGNIFDLERNDLVKIKVRTDFNFEQSKQIEAIVQKPAQEFPIRSSALFEYSGVRDLLWSGTNILTFYLPLKYGGEALAGIAYIIIDKSPLTLAPIAPLHRDCMNDEALGYNSDNPILIRASGYNEDTPGKNVILESFEVWRPEDKGFIDVTDEITITTPEPDDEDQNFYFSYTLSPQSSNYTEGEYRVRVRGTDGLNPAQTIWQFFIDRTPPEVKDVYITTFQDREETDIFSQEMLQDFAIGYLIEDNLDEKVHYAENLKVEIYDKDNVLIKTLIDKEEVEYGRHLHYWDFTNNDGKPYLGEGKHIVKITVTDKAGNTSFSTKEFFLDHTPPELSNITPLLPNPFTSVSGEMSFNYTVSEDAILTIIFEELSSGWIIPMVNVGLEGENTFTWTGETGLGEFIRDGVYKVYVFAQDEAGNQSEIVYLYDGKEENFFRIDCTPPLVSQFLAQPMVLTSAMLETNLSYRLSEANDAEANILDEEKISKVEIALIREKTGEKIEEWLDAPNAKDTDNSITFDSEGKNLAPGRYQFIIKAYDEFGNFSTTKTELIKDAILPEIIVSIDEDEALAGTVCIRGIATDPDWGNGLPFLSYELYYAQGEQTVPEDLNNLDANIWKSQGLYTPLEYRDPAHNNISNSPMPDIGTLAWWDTSFLEDDTKYTLLLVVREEGSGYALGTTKSVLVKSTSAATLPQLQISLNPDAEFHPDEGNPLDIGYQLSKAKARVIVKVIDNENKVVFRRTLDNIIPIWGKPDIDPDVHIGYFFWQDETGYHLHWCGQSKDDVFSGAIEGIGYGRFEGVNPHNLEEGKDAIKIGDELIEFISTGEEEFNDLDGVDFQGNFNELRLTLKINGSTEAAKDLIFISADKIHPGINPFHLPLKLADNHIFWDGEYPWGAFVDNGTYAIKVTAEGIEYPGIVTEEANIEVESQLAFTGFKITPQDKTFTPTDPTSDINTLTIEYALNKGAYLTVEVIEEETGEVLRKLLDGAKRAGGKEVVYRISWDGGYGAGEVASPDKTYTLKFTAEPYDSSGIITKEVEGIKVINPSQSPELIAILDPIGEEDANANGISEVEGRSDFIYEAEARGRYYPPQEFSYNLEAQGWKKREFSWKVDGKAKETWFTYSTTWHNFSVEQGDANCGSKSTYISSNNFTPAQTVYCHIEYCMDAAVIGHPEVWVYINDDQIFYCEAYGWYNECDYDTKTFTLDTGELNKEIKVEVCAGLSSAWIKASGRYYRINQHSHSAWRYGSANGNGSKENIENYTDWEYIGSWENAVPQPQQGGSLGNFSYTFTVNVDGISKFVTTSTEPKKITINGLDIYFGNPYTGTQTKEVYARVSEPNSSPSLWKEVVQDIPLGSVIYVPKDYPFIQEAIDNASQGSIIKVNSGEYAENLVITKENITIIGETPYNTLIYPEDETKPVITYDFSSSENDPLVPDGTLKGFSIFHKGGASSSYGIHCIDASPVIRKNVICGFDCGIYLENSNSKIINNTLALNNNGIFCNDSFPLIKNNIISYCDGWFGICCGGESEPAISYNDVWLGESSIGFEYLGCEPGEGDISSDPEFVDLANYDFHLTDTSPCIDAADPHCGYNDPDGSRGDMGIGEIISKHLFLEYQGGETYEEYSLLIFDNPEVFDLPDDVIRESLRYQLTESLPNPAVEMKLVDDSGEEYIQGEFIDPAHEYYLKAAIVPDWNPIWDSTADQTLINGKIVSELIIFNELTFDPDGISDVPYIISDAYPFENQDICADRSIVNQYIFWADDPRTPDKEKNPQTKPYLDFTDQFNVTEQEEGWQITLRYLSGEINDDLEVIDLVTHNYKENIKDSFKLKLKPNASPKQFVEIKGKASDAYELYYQDGESWKLITSSDEGKEGTLGWWEVTNLYGKYLVLLKVKDDEGRVKTTTQEIEIGKVFKPGDTNQENLIYSSAYRRVEVKFNADSFPNETLVSVVPRKIEELGLSEMPDILPLGPIIQVRPSGVTFEEEAMPTITYKFTYDDVYDEYGNPRFDLEQLHLYQITDTGELICISNVVIDKPTPFEPGDVLTLTATISHTSDFVLLEGTPQLITPTLVPSQMITNRNSVSFIEGCGSPGQLIELYIDDDNLYHQTADPTPPILKGETLADTDGNYTFNEINLPYEGDNHLFVKYKVSNVYLGNGKIIKDQTAPAIIETQVTPATFFPQTAEDLVNISCKTDEPTIIHLNCYNSKGELIFTRVGNCDGENGFSVLWDGKNENGNFASSGDYRVQFMAIDKAGNISQTKEERFTVVNMGIKEVNVGDVPNDQGGRLKVRWRRSPSLGEDRDILWRYKILRSNTIDGVYEEICEVIDDGSQEYEYIDKQLKDYNQYYYKVTMEAIDIPPVVSKTVGPVSPQDNLPPITSDDIPLDWQSKDFIITLTVDDGEEAGHPDYKTYYAIDGSDTFSEGTTISITQSGAHTIKYYSVDEAGNVEQTKTSPRLAKLDKETPVSQISFIGYSYSEGENRADNPTLISFSTLIELSAEDEYSGIKQIYYQVDEGGWKIYEQPIDLNCVGNFTISYYSEDNAGNREGEKKHYIFMGSLDLNISSSDIIFSNLDKTCSITVHNSGEMPLKDIKVAIYDDPQSNPDNEKKIGEKIIPEIAAHSSAEISFELSSLSLTRHNLFAWVDPYNEIAEDNEENNIVSFSIYLGDFWQLPQLITDTGEYKALHCVDFDGDGKEEIIAGLAGGRNSTVEIWSYNLDSEEWELKETITGSGWHDPHDIASGDFDKDGDIDLVVTMRWVGLWVLINEGDGNWSQYHLDRTYGWQVEVVDFDNDGNLDILDVTDWGYIKIFYGDGAGDFVQGGAPVCPATYGAGSFIPIDV
ncbi:MAG: hypothetical protein DRG33_00725, partial [Deltaproteobacteria bacterium]